VLVLSISMFAGFQLCGCKAEAIAAEKEAVEIVLWKQAKEDPFHDQQRVIFTENNPYITFDTIVREGDPGNDYLQGVAIGSAPDFVLCSFAVIDAYIRAGILAPLTEYWENYEDKDKFVKNFIDMVSLDGEIYGVPHRGFPMLFGYNKALFADAGLEGPPKTWDEMLEYAKILTKPEVQQYGYNMLASQWCEWWFQYYVWQAGGDLTKKNPDGTLTLTFTDPAVIEAAEYYQKLRREGLIQPDITLNFEGLVKNFAAGKVGMMPFASDWVSWAVSLGMNPDDIGLAPFPAGPAGKTTAAISGDVWVINPNISQEKKDACWEYIKFRVSKDYLTGFYQDLEAKGAVNPDVLVRSDIKLTEIVNIDPSYEAALNNAAQNGRAEFYGKSTVGKYIDQAVQKIVSDLNADPLTVFRDAQELATNEVLEGQ